jgi:hypothetical protein
MSTELLTIIVLVVMFVIATTVPVNLGANAPKDIDTDRFYRQMLVYSGVAVAAGPLLAWLLLVVPGW